MPKFMKQADKKLLLHVEDDAKLAELRAEVAAFERKLPEDRARLASAEQALAHAQDALDLAESRLLAGRGDEATFASAQAALADAKRAQAIALHTLSDTERMLRLLPPAIRTARAAAKKQVVANLRAQYAEQVAALKAKLLETAELNRAVQATYERAVEELPANEPYAHEQLDGLWFCEDLGDGGVTPKAGRLPDLTFTPLVTPFHRHESDLDVWLKAADALLAALPAMEAHDKEALTRRLADEPARRAAEAEKVQRMLAFARRDVERFAPLLVSPAPRQAPAEPPRQ